MSAPHTFPSVSSSVCYKDPKAALKWLEQAFGFEPFMVILSDKDELMHSEMRFGDGVIMVGSEWSAVHRSPASIDGLNTQTVHVQLNEDVDAHCERARKAGAKIVKEPETQFYGDRTYRAADPEGHIWSFGQTVKEMTPEQWETAMPGIKTKSRL
ncbi:MAG TPA: VOC family protein [Steroidobacteraceae bacterium]|nr:VOC family protein [Steroidobacteraceae bacterium]